MLIALRTRRPDRGSARGIQQPKLDPDCVGYFAHDPAQGIDFPDPVSLGNAANCGVARHLRNEIDVEGIKSGLQTHAGRSHGGFSSSMTRPNDHDVKLLSKLLHQW